MQVGKLQGHIFFISIQTFKTSLLTFLCTYKNYIYIYKKHVPKPPPVCELPSALDRLARYGLSQQQVRLHCDAWGQSCSGLLSIRCMPFLEGRGLHLATGSMRYDTVYHTSISVCHTLRYTTRLLFCTSRCHTRFNFNLYWYYVFAILSLLYQTVLYCSFLQKISLYTDILYHTILQYSL